jgi:alpha-tubulin suppressor-like RCC1 family protein
MKRRFAGAAEPGGVRRAARIMAFIALVLAAVLVPARGGHAQSTGYVEVSAGHEFTCGLKSDGSVACWGDNYWGQAPATRAGPYTHIAAGAYHVCALRPDSTVACWGRNTYRISDPTGYVDVYVGQADPPAGHFKQLSGGEYLTCGLTTEGQAQCWGHGSDRLGPFTQLSAGREHVCAVRETDSTAECWGADGYGQASPPAGVKVTQVTAGENHTCAIKTDGNVICWGGNTWLQAPANRAGPDTQIDAGDLFTCGLRTNGAIDCWGYNLYGQHRAPLGVYTQISAGGGHACAVDSESNVVCWGRNDFGQALPPVLAGTRERFDFAGFYAPVEPAPALNAVKAGSAVPLKFSLDGNKGLAVLAAGYPASQPLDCVQLDPGGEPVAASSAGRTGLSYDPMSEQYTYVWKTEKAWLGTCRVLSMRLIDGTEHLAAFRFR